MWGSGSQLIWPGITTEIYNGEQLAAHDVVMVTLNYRIGILGLLYANSSDAPGNQLLWDQNMALKWVNENIREFGGDPNKVTVFGESAGSISTSIHVLSPFTKGVNNIVIVMSLLS